MDNSLVLVIGFIWLGVGLLGIGAGLTKKDISWMVIVVFVAGGTSCTAIEHLYPKKVTQTQSAP